MPDYSDLKKILSTFKCLLVETNQYFNIMRKVIIYYNKKFKIFISTPSPLLKSKLSKFSVTMSGMRNVVNKLT